MLSVEKMCFVQRCLMVVFNCFELVSLFCQWCQPKKVLSVSKEHYCLDDWGG
jgi:hypothetical protein